MIRGPEAPRCDSRVPAPWVTVVAALALAAGGALACGDAPDAPAGRDAGAQPEADSAAPAERTAEGQLTRPRTGEGAGAVRRGRRAADISDTVVYVYAQDDSAWGDCDTGNAGCATARLRYPVLVSAPSVPALVSLEAAADSMVLARPFVDGPVAPGTDALIGEFFDEYRLLAEDMPDIPFGYLLERDVVVAYNTPTLVTLAFHESSHTGGAHPNSHTVYRSFDARTGVEVALEDLLAPGALPLLTEMAEAAFRRQKGLAPDADLGEAGYSFEEGGFALGDGFLPSDTALAIHYNSYEIAAYAEGPTTLVIPLAEVAPLLREGGAWRPGEPVAPER